MTSLAVVALVISFVFDLPIGPALRRLDAIHPCMRLVLMLYLWSILTESVVDIRVCRELFLNRFGVQ